MFDAFFRENYAAYVRLAFLVLHDDRAAEEVVQDSFATVLERWDSIQNHSAYLRVVVVNECRSTIKRGARTQPTPDAGLDSSVRDAPVELWDVLWRLNVRQRTAIVLRYYEQLDDAAIAEALGCRRPTVRTLIHRGMATMRRELQQ